MNKLMHLLGLTVLSIKKNSMYLSLTISELETLKTLETSGKNRKTMINHINHSINSFNKKPIISTGGKTLEESDIELFYSHRSKNCNDESNKNREYIIKALSDGNPYPDNQRWIELHNKFNIFIDKLKSLASKYTHQSVNSYKIKTKGGRRNHYDFNIIFYNDNNTLIQEYKIEFKNNACNVNDCPQYVSPMKLSKYFDCDKTYEELFYDEYLPSICSKVNQDIPDKTIYLKQIHGNNPKCMIPFTEAYYKGSKQSSKYTGLEEDIQNYNYMNEKSRQSIKEFLEGSQLKISEMNQYLIDTQKDKKYMLWGNNDFHYQEVDPNDYTIDKILRIKKDNTVVCLTKSNKEMNILLRWKNGNGVAFPALQIS